MTDCVFCEIIQERVANEPFTPLVHIIEPLNPVTDGHVLFVPAEHYRHAAERPMMTGFVMRAASEYAAARFSMDDYNLITSGGSDATQTVFHLHIHYVPRRENDGLSLPWTGQVKK